MFKKVVLQSIVFVVTCTAPPVCGAQLLAIPRYDKVQTAVAAIDTATQQAPLFADYLAAMEIRNESGLLAMRRWNPLTREARAALLWAQEPSQLLPGAQLSVGSSSGAIFTELASVLSGAWRISAATTLGVAEQDTGNGEEDARAGKDTATAFKNFVAGGGNLSLQGIRPLAIRPAGRSNQYLLAVPRAWVDAPGLGTTDDVRSGGGEIGAEYQYHRLADEGGQPFLVLQLRGSFVVGSKEFYQGIGHSDERPFAYLAPAMSFFVADQVKIGVTGFVGPSTLSDQPRVQLSLAILKQKDGASK